MKKLLTLVMALALCLSLTACGGVDTQPAVDAFNAATTEFDALANEINAEIDAFDPELIALLQDMSEALTMNKELLEGDTELTEENVAEMVQNFNEIEAWCKEVHETLDTFRLPAFDLQALQDTFTTAQTAFDALATKMNANIEAYDQELIDVMNTMSEALVSAGTVLQSGIEMTAEQAIELQNSLIGVYDWVVAAEAELFG